MHCAWFAMIRLKISIRTLVKERQWVLVVWKKETTDTVRNPFWLVQANKTSNQGWGRGNTIQDDTASQAKRKKRKRKETQSKSWLTFGSCCSLHSLRSWLSMHPCCLLFGFLVPPIFPLYLLQSLPLVPSLILRHSPFCLLLLPRSLRVICRSPLCFFLLSFLCFHYHYHPLLSLLTCVVVCVVFIFSSSSWMSAWFNFSCNSSLRRRYS